MVSVQESTSSYLGFSTNRMVHVGSYLLGLVQNRTPGTLLSRIRYRIVRLNSNNSTLGYLVLGTEKTGNSIPDKDR